MDAPFPLGFPFATGFYLTLYVLTLVIHVVFMNYVLAGSAYLALTNLMRRGRQPSAMAAVLRDWLPFALSAAITAGVAPLLFIQVLYKQSFYTANLLLFHRWMSLLPVLIIGFYLLYVLKSRIERRWPAIVEILVSFGAFGCFAFTGYSWTENHLLSQHQEVWSEFYASGRLFYWHPLLLSRLGVWFSGSLPTMVAIAGWQLWSLQRRGAMISAPGVRGAAALALVGLSTAAIFGGLYYWVAGEQDRMPFGGPLAGPYVVAAVVGLALQAVAWMVQIRAIQFEARWLLLASVGALITIVGTTVVREAVRISSIDITLLYGRHAETARVGGRVVFLVFLVLCSLAIAWCITTVKRSMRTSAR